jgi:hypothetical protein
MLACCSSDRDTEKNQPRDKRAIVLAQRGAFASRHDGQNSIRRGQCIDASGESPCQTGRPEHRQPNARLTTASPGRVTGVTVVNSPCRSSQDAITCNFRALPEGFGIALGSADLAPPGAQAAKPACETSRPVEQSAVSHRVQRCAQSSTTRDVSSTRKVWRDDCRHDEMVAQDGRQCTASTRGHEARFRGRQVLF